MDEVDLARAEPKGQVTYDEIVRLGAEQEPGLTLQRDCPNLRHPRGHGGHKTMMLVISFRSMKPLLPLFLIIASAFVGGCANPSIVQLSPDTYMLSRADRAGIFGNTAALKAGVIKDANEFAESKGKVAIPVSVHETPVYPGHFATVEYQFKVLDRNDPEAKRTTLVQRADVVIERNEKVTADIRTKDDTIKSSDLYTEITKLDDLRKKGLISDAEFEQQKQKLLNK